MSLHSDPIVQAALAAFGKATGNAPVVTTNSAVPAGATIAQPNGNGVGLTNTVRSAAFSNIDQAVGTVLNPEDQMGLMVRMRRTTGLAKYISIKETTAEQGRLDMLIPDTFRMRATSKKAPRTGIPTAGFETSTDTFATKAVSGGFTLDLRTLKAMSRAGTSPNDLVRSAIAEGIANMILDTGINGDTSITGNDPDSMQRKVVNGWMKKLEAAGRTASTSNGINMSYKAYRLAHQNIDPMYRAAGAFVSSDRLFAHPLTELTGLNGPSGTTHPSIVNQTGQTLLNGVLDIKPLGRPVVPAFQFLTDRPGAEGYAGVAPNTVTNNGDGTITFNINTHAGTADLSGSGLYGATRYCYVKCSRTGIEELCAVTYAASNNTLTTAALLGQTSGSVSTTAGDYSVRWGDLTDLYYGDPKHLVAVLGNGIRVYTQFSSVDERFEVIVHADLDYMVIDPLAAYTVRGIVSPLLTIADLAP